MKHHLILRIVSKLLIPFILLFGLYVQFHGDFGPGGGFQAGVIFAAGVFLYGLIFGLENARKVFPDSLINILMPFGALLYAGVGVANMFLGDEFLHYSNLAPVHTTGQHIGILVIEAGVGITVAAVMISIFMTFTSREP